MKSVKILNFFCKDYFSQGIYLNWIININIMEIIQLNKQNYPKLWWIMSDRHLELILTIRVV